MFLAGSVLIVLYLSPMQDFNDAQFSGVATLLVFLAALPLVNVVFDWLSLGLTRLLLGWTAKGQKTGAAILNGCLDAVGAVVILAALAVATTAALQGLNTVATLGGSDRLLIDLVGVIQTLRERPGDPAIWWVYFMLFSTLLPSVVHLFIAASSLATYSLPRSLMEKHQKALEAGFEGHPRARGRTALTMTIRQFLSWGAFLAALAAIAALLVFVLPNAMPWLGLALLWLAEHTAAALSAPIVPGPPPWGLSELMNVLASLLTM